METKIGLIVWWARIFFVPSRPKSNISEKNDNENEHKTNVREAADAGVRVKTNGYAHDEWRETGLYTRAVVGRSYEPIKQNRDNEEDKLYL